MNYGDQMEVSRMALIDQRAHARRYLANNTALEAVMADIAEGTKVTDIAKRLGVEYQALYTILVNTYKEQYKAARAAYAEVLAEKNLDMADKVEKLELPHDAAKTAASLRQWHMERTAGEQWGQRSSVDVTHRGVVGLHLEAIRQLANEPLEGEYEEVDPENESEGESASYSADRARIRDGGADDADGDDNLDREGDTALRDHPLL